MAQKRFKKIVETGLVSDLNLVGVVGTIFLAFFFLFVSLTSIPEKTPMWVYMLLGGTITIFIMCTIFLMWCYFDDRKVYWVED